jgi:hypothetical protein
MMCIALAILTLSLGAILGAVAQHWTQVWICVGA